jgi:hypothetical protein
MIPAVFLKESHFKLRRLKPKFVSLLIKETFGEENLEGTTIIVTRG